MPTNRARAVLQAEAAAVAALSERLDATTLEAAVALVLRHPGNTVCTGVGKSWLIAQKWSATFASTGTPGLALHPTEALHGDLGRLRPGDPVFALSASGRSEELLHLLPSFAALSCPLLVVTADATSPLARAATLRFDLGPLVEACPLGLAPSVSTTVMLALGDALAFAVMEARGFGALDYAERHPGGALGRRLMAVDAVMRPLGETAIVEEHATVRAALSAITQKRTGAAFVVDANGVLLGVFTDGDLRRHVEDLRLLEEPIASVMTRPGLRVVSGAPANEAAALFQRARVGELPVVDEAGRILGHVGIKDLVARRFLDG